MEIACHPLVLFCWILLAVVAMVAAQSPVFRKFLDSADAQDLSGLRLSNPLVGYDGRIYACCRKNLFAFESNGTVAWIIPLNYLCRMDIPPVGDGRGKVFLIAEDRVMKVNPLNIGTAEPVVEIFYGPNSTIGGSGEIIGLSISITLSALFITVKDRGVFAFRLRGDPMWSAGPVLHQFGYAQGCKKNLTDCHFNSAPVVDQCEGTLYISNTEGQLYALYTRSPHFRWIQDFSSLDKEFLITAGNNGHLYVTFPRSSLLLALDVSTGNVLWKHNVGPLSREDCSPVVDSNGWVSIGSLDGFLYSVSPAGDLKKFLKASSLDSVIQVSPILDCSGFAIYVAQTSVEGKTSYVVGEYTYVSAMKSTKVVYVLLSPATGAIYPTGTSPGELLSDSDLSYFRPEERILLALLASESLNITWPCYTAREKLRWTCSQTNPEFVSGYTANEKAILLFLLFQSVIIVLLAVSVRFCWTFWRKKKLQEKDLGRFLEKRHSLHLRKKEFKRMISELGEKATEESTANEVLGQLEDIVKAKEGIEKKLSTTYSLGRDGTGSRRTSLLPLYDGKTRSYSFHSGKKESVTIFNTLSDTATSTGRSDSGRSGSDGDFSSTDSREEDSYSSGDGEATAKGKAPVEDGASSSSRKLQEEYYQEPMSPEETQPAEPSLSRNTSSRRLNAQALEFVPRSPPASHAQARLEPRVVQIHHAPPAPPPVMHIFHHHHPPRQQAFHHVPVVQGHSQFEYYGGGEGGYGDHEMVHSPVDPPPATATSDGLPDDVIQKITKQVEYYFSDANLATTEHLMRFISKDPEGFVPISVIAAFKKIKALISNTAQLAAALRTSSKLIVSDDGKKVRRLHPFTEADVEELQSRIIVAENLPEDHCYQSLLKVFSVVGSVKAIRTCYPQATNGAASTTSRPGKIDTLFGNKLHAFVEYESIEGAEKAVAELNDERDWRSGLRVRLLPTCMTKHGRGRKCGHEGDRIGDDEDVSISNQHHEKHFEDPSQQVEVLQEHMGDDDHHDKEGGRRGRGRGRGSRGRGRGQYNHLSHRTGHVVAAPSSHPTTVEQPAATKQPPGPRMPDGTRGFTMGRGKQLGTANVVSS